MDCTHVESLLSALLDGELDERAPVDAHLAECARCRTTLDELRADDSALESLFDDARRRAEGLEERVVASVRRERGGRVIPFWLPVASAAAGFLLAILLFRPWERPAPQVVYVETPDAAPIARVTVVSGDVELFDDGAWRPVTQSADILPDMIVRSKKGKAELACADGNVVRLDEETEVQFKADRRLRLERGQLWCAGEEMVQVDSGDSTLEGGSGCVVNASKSKDTTRYDCEQGQSSVTDSSGKTLSLKEQERVIVTEGQAGDPRPADDLELATKWVMEIAALKGDDDPEFNRRMQLLMARIGEKKVQYLTEEDVKSLGTNCVRPLKAYVQETAGADSARYKRRQAAEWVAMVAGATQTPDLLDLLADEDPEVRVYVAQGLRRILGDEAFPRGDKFWREGEAAERSAELQNLRR